jgi:hypothetical protein
VRLYEGWGFELQVARLTLTAHTFVPYVLPSDFFTVAKEESASARAHRPPESFPTGSNRTKPVVRTSLARMISYRHHRRLSCAGSCPSLAK